MAQHKNSKRLYIILWLLCIGGSWAALPYMKLLGLTPPEAPLSQLFIPITLQAAIMFGVALWLSSIMVPRTDLKPFQAKDLMKTAIFPGLIWGVALGLVVVLLNGVIYKDSLLLGRSPPRWAGFLSAFYGAINEEVQLRLFFFTLVYFLFAKIFRFKEAKRTPFLWITNAIVALAFGLGHLPAALKLGAGSSYEVSRILLLNGIPGLAFGWLYWSRSLWAAMVAHFVADLVMHVVFI